METMHKPQLVEEIDGHGDTVNGCAFHPSWLPLLLSSTGTRKFSLKKTSKATKKRQRRNSSSFTSLSPSPSPSPSSSSAGGGTRKLEEEEEENEEEEEGENAVYLWRPHFQTLTTSFDTSAATGDTSESTTTGDISVTTVVAEEVTTERLQPTETEMGVTLAAITSIT
jgi:hypothetical protein